MATIKEVVEFFNSQEGMPEGLRSPRLSLSEEVMPMSQTDRGELCSCLDTLRKLES